jgi:hypothetical protein
MWFPTPTMHMIAVHCLDGTADMGESLNQQPKSPFDDTQHFFLKENSQGKSGGNIYQ